MGVKAVQAKLVRFSHNNLKDLEEKITQCNPKKNSILVVVESLYSMEGSIAPLREITEICKKNSVPVSYTHLRAHET